MLPRAARAILRRITAYRNLDRRVCSWRLEALHARHTEISAISSLDDSPGAPSPRLLQLLPVLAERALTATLPLAHERCAPGIIDLWPGEHYRLLVALVQGLNPSRIVEIGTLTGLSSLAIIPLLTEGAQLTTFDIVPWHEVPNTFLR